MKIKQFFIKILPLFLVIFVTDCAVNPVTGKKELSFMSEKGEQRAGDQADPAIQATYGVYEDAAMQKFINEKGNQMARISHRPNLKYTFRIVDSPVVNAFALPGGYVYFTRGIMAHFNNEAEFMGVLGHEIGHITARHSAKQQRNQILSQVLLIGGMIASPQFRQYGEQAMQGVQLMNLKFGRDHESQSDKLGVEYSTKVGYDSHYMADFFETINRLQQQAGVSIPDFLSTHPNPVDRYNKVHQMTDEIQGEMSQTKFKVNRERYLRMIDGIIYGEDPKQGFVENNKFYHPELKFQFDVPRRWKHQNAPSQFQMAPEDGKALMQLSLGKGASLEEAAQAFVEQHKLTVVVKKNKTVNGIKTLAFVADQNPQQQQSIRIMTYLYEYNGLIYKMNGISSKQDYSRYEVTFDQVMNSFEVCKDPNILNRKPDRVRIKTAPKNGTLNQILRDFQMPADEMDALSILNGMKLTDQVKKGDLVKTLGK